MLGRMVPARSGSRPEGEREAVMITTGSFQATDRCDRCAARARLRVVLAGGELQFCNHHGRKHRAALEPVAVLVEYDKNGTWIP